MITSEKYDGMTLKDAIKVRNSNEELQHLTMELGKKGVDWMLAEKTVFWSGNGKSYDRVDVVLFDGQKRSYYFDVSDMAVKYRYKFIASAPLLNS